MFEGLRVSAKICDGEIGNKNERIDWSALSLLCCDSGDDDDYHLMVLFNLGVNTNIIYLSSSG